MTQGLLQRLRIFLFGENTHVELRSKIFTGGTPAMNLAAMQAYVEYRKEQLRLMGLELDTYSYLRELNFVSDLVATLAGYAAAVEEPPAEEEETINDLTTLILNLADRRGDSMAIIAMRDLCKIPREQFDGCVAAWEDYLNDPVGTVTTLRNGVEVPAIPL